MITIKEGFEFEGFKYGFKNKKLLRLPTEKNGRNYPVKVVPVIKLSATGKGYRLCREKKSLDQVKSLIKKVNWKYDLILCKECL